MSMRVEMRFDRNRMNSVQGWGERVCSSQSGGNSPKVTQELWIGWKLFFFKAGKNKQRRSFLPVKGSKIWVINRYYCLLV